MNVLFVGESWFMHTSHVKGFDTFTHTEYNEGTKWFKAAMESNNIKFTHIPAHLVGEQFPTSQEELKEYDAVFLSDIGSNTMLMNKDTFNNGIIQKNNLELIKEYVENGGGFGMIGGYMTFQGVEAKGKYKDSVIEEILPVNLLTGDDRAEHPEGITPTILQKNHPILDGISDQWPYFLGYNKLKSKEEAIVIAEHNGDAFISVMDFKKGRTFAFASDCAPHWGPKEFVEWKYYNQFWGNVVSWLGNSKK